MLWHPMDCVDSTMCCSFAPALKSSSPPPPKHVMKCWRISLTAKRRPHRVWLTNRPRAWSCLWSACCLLSVWCLGPCSVSKQGMGKTVRHPAMQRLFGMRGKCVFEVKSWPNNRTCRRSGSRQLSNAGSLLVFHVFWPSGLWLRLEDHLRSSGSVSVSLGKVSVSICSNFGVMTVSGQGTIRHHRGMTLTDARLKENLKIICLCGCKSTTTTPPPPVKRQRGRDADGEMWPPWPFSKALRLFPK